MRTAFALPSCNYNIELTKDDLEQLLEKGYITMRTTGLLGTDLTYNDGHGPYPVQYVCVSTKK